MFKVLTYKVIQFKTQTGSATVFKTEFLLVVCLCRGKDIFYEFN